MQFVGQEWICWDTYVSFQEIAATPVVPETNQLRLYSLDKSGVSALYYLDDAGVEHQLTDGYPSGTGIANRLTYWTGASTIAALAALTPTRIPFADANGLPTDDSGLIWNSTNKDLIIGATASAPFSSLSGS